MNDKIAFVGKQRCGKSTSCLLLQSLGYTKMGLADPVKAVTVEMINTFYRYLGEPEMMTRERLERDKTELRWLLQGVGTDLGRNYLGPDSIWIELLLSRVKTYELTHGDEFRVVVEDTRFLNEVKALRSQGFTIVKILRDESERTAAIRADGVSDEHLQRILSHPSETEVDLIEADITIANTSLEELRNQVMRLAGWPSLAVAA